MQTRNLADGILFGGLKVKQKQSTRWLDSSKQVDAKYRLELESYANLSTVVFWITLNLHLVTIFCNDRIVSCLYIFVVIKVAGV